MLKTNKITNSIIVLMALFSIFSCDNKRIFDDYKSIKNGSWDKDNKISFDFVVNDTLAKQNLFINLRNNNDYEFSNLFIITKLSFPSGEKIIDTLEYEMTDNSGRFLGSGFTEIKENKLFYKENIIFPKKGNYNILIEQAMRKNGEIEGISSLKGVTEVGFRIEK